MRIKKFGIAKTLLASAFTCSIPLLLIPINAQALSPVCTWTGGGVNTNWSNSANWSCTSGTVPVNGDSVAFNDNLVGSLTPINEDIVGLQLDNITFTGSSFGGYQFSGSTTLTVSGGITDSNDGPGTNSINVGVTLANDLSFSLSNG